MREPPGRFINEIKIIFWKDPYKLWPPKTSFIGMQAGYLEKDVVYETKRY